MIPKALFRRETPERRASLYRSVEYLALHGMHAQTIADVCGLSVSQVYTACGHMQIKLRDYRDGKGPVGSAVVSQAKTKPKGKKSG